ncbi:MAG: cobalamin-binding protein [Gammaproteobacteria bacterium]
MTGFPDIAGWRLPGIRILSVIGVLVLVALLAVAGCDAPDRPPGPSSVSEAIADQPARELPARRIVALSPHLTELAYAAGAGQWLVAVVAFSNEPPAARALPRVGDAFRLDLEALATVRPDLILGWPSGNSPAALDRLRRLGYRVVELEPRQLADIGDQIELIGRLAGTEPAAATAARHWREGLAALRARYSGAKPGRVFYQIAARPLITVNRDHFIGQAIRLCGGVNVYADVPGMAPVVSIESVIAAAPDIIVASDYTPGPGRSATDSPVDMWRSWANLPAVANHRLIVVDPGLLAVPGPRMLEGIRQLCVALNG